MENSGNLSPENENFRDPRESEESGKKTQKRKAKRYDPEVYKRYAAARDEKGYKDAEIARMTKVGAYDFTKWKGGEYTPGPAKLLAISDALGINLRWLLHGQEPKYNTEEFATRVNADTGARTAADSFSDPIKDSASGYDVSAENGAAPLTPPESGYADYSAVEPTDPAQSDGASVSENPEDSERLNADDQNGFRTDTNDQNSSQTDTDDPAYRDTIEALRRMTPVKRNLFSALIAICADDDPK